MFNSVQYDSIRGKRQWKYIIVHDKIMDRYRMHFRFGVYRHRSSRMHHL